MITKTKIALAAALVLTSASAALAAPRLHGPATFQGQASVPYFVQHPAQERWMDRASQESTGGSGF